MKRFATRYGKGSQPVKSQKSSRIPDRIIFLCTISTTVHKAVQPSNAHRKKSPRKRECIRTYWKFGISNTISFEFTGYNILGFRRIESSKSYTCVFLGFIATKFSLPVVVLHLPIQQRIWRIYSLAGRLKEIFTWQHIKISNIIQ